MFLRVAGSFTAHLLYGCIQQQKCSLSTKTYNQKSALVGIRFNIFIILDICINFDEEQTFNTLKFYPIPFK